MSKTEIILYIFSLVVGIVMWLLPKTLPLVIGALVIIFGLLIYPIWNFPFIEKSLWLRLGGLLFIASCLCVLGYFSSHRNITTTEIETNLKKWANDTGYQIKNASHEDFRFQFIITNNKGVSFTIFNRKSDDPLNVNILGVLKFLPNEQKIFESLSYDFQRQFINDLGIELAKTNVEFEIISNPLSDIRFNKTFLYNDKTTKTDFLNEVGFVYRVTFISARTVRKQLEYQISNKDKEVDTAEKQQFDSPGALIGSHLKGLTIRISDLVGDDFIIRNKTIEDSYLYGPAIIVFDGGVVSHNTFDSKIDDLLIEVKPETKLRGVVVFQNCKIINNKFFKVNIMADEKHMQLFKEGIK